MARPSKYPRYTEGYIDRHGKPRFYLRRPGAKRVALPGLPWSPEFMAAYQAAIDGVTLAARPIGATRALVGSTAEVVARYLLDASFTTLAASTRDKRRRFLDAFRAHYGKLPFAKLDTPSVAALLGKLTAHNQRDWLKTLRGLVRFAMARGYIGTDVTLGLRSARAKATGGYRTWQDEHIETYRAHWPRGTAQRLALELMVGMAGRRGDVVKLGWQHIRHGKNGPEIWYRQTKPATRSRACR